MPTPNVGCGQSRTSACQRSFLFGERSLRRAMKDYIAHYHTERNHQGKNNLLLFHRISKADTTSQCDAAIGWADFCGTIIKRQRELAVRLRLHRRGSVHDWRL